MCPPEAARGAPAQLEPLLEEHLDDLYEQAPCGYLSTLLDGSIVRANATLLGWLGYAFQDLGRLRMQELLAPGDRIFYETHYAPLLQMQGAAREVAVELVRRDGSRLPVLLTSVLRTDEDGIARVVRTTVFDARDRRRYEQELLRARREAEARARTAAALEHVSDGVLALDGQGRITVANTAARAILEIAAEAPGSAAAEAIEGWEALAERVPVGTADGPPAPATLPLARGGVEQWLAIVGVHSGEGVVYTIRDVTADRRLEAMRDELIGIVSHELRTPLTGVYGAAQTLAARPDLPEATRTQLLGMIVSQTERLRRIIEEILLTRRLDADDVGVAETRVDLVETASAAAAEVAAALGGEERLRLEAGAPAVVAADPDWTRQALANLVENALQYSPAERPVLVRVSAGDRHGRVTVSDEGPGIPAAERERIFERFSRLDANVSGGAGLGLYIARELVLRMGGRIGLEPRDRGSTFFVELPLAEG